MPYGVAAVASRAMNEWAWVLITKDGVTRYPGVGPQAAYAAVGVDPNGDTVTGDGAYFIEFQRC
ncbi:hypothetical protein TUM20983_27970 [Mycobacterium antarcticum]|nr:hypothetical protein TUM20983_27970 [Mycolicibacterium sp. TUM20983]GLP83970.1 hypothetical protein TUM20984_53900 [Mycolicibacterium sp. TUM20984]